MENELHVPDGNRSTTEMTGLAAHPDDVLNHPRLTKAEKRAVLASWASDSRAVEGAPALRQIDSGAVVEIDDIMQALKSLDGLGTLNGREPLWTLPLAGQGARFRRHRRVERLLGRDDDDDPPPFPALAALPVRMSVIRAFSRDRDGEVRLHAA